MAITKPQLKTIDTLKNGGHIFLVNNEPYIAEKNDEGKTESRKLNRSIFSSLRMNKIIKEVDGKWLAAV